MTFHNPELAELVPDGPYNADDLVRVERALADHQTLTFSRLPSGLFSASPAGDSIASSGYGSVWLRDNVYAALAHDVSGKTDVAVDVVRALVTFFSRYLYRFDGIISGEVDPQDVSRRPQVRFDGVSLSEIAGEPWAHAQNDALGYFLWLSCRLAARGRLEPDPDTVAVLSRLIRYFEAIRFWQDEDSGQWEETRKLSASSIGTVVAGLQAFLALASTATEASWRREIGSDLPSLAHDLIQLGRQALAAVLPSECTQIYTTRNRRYDAALLFLLCPLEVVDDQAVVELVLHDIATDPILSAHYGRRALNTESLGDRSKQIVHFNRSLAQITKEWRCAELYYLRGGTYIPNPHVPLQWTQANLVLALQGMRATICV